jgi:hypothetical protein
VNLWRPNYTSLLHVSLHFFALDHFPRLCSISGLEPKQNFCRILGVAINLFRFDAGHATARDAMFNNYKVVFLSDATGSFDYPDVGYGAMSAEEVHKATLCILAFSTAHVMTVDELKTQIERGTTAVRAKRKKAA